MAYVVGFAGFSNSGKTTLVAKVTAMLKREGSLVAVMKHDAHGHYKEVEGTDSASFIQAGADSVVTLSPQAVHRYDKQNSVSFEQALSTLQEMDYVLVEGFKMEAHPKIAVFRTQEQSEIVSIVQEHIIAIATDTGFEHPSVPVFHLDDAKGIAAFIQSRKRDK